MRALLVLIGCGSLAHAWAAVDAGPASAPRMEFTPPAPGSYRLPAIQAVAAAALLDERGAPVHLSDLTHGKITLLTFFYSYCVDPLGCPFARETLRGLRAQLLTEPALAARVRFVGISCDPDIDTPATLARYASQVAGASRFEWHFLTAPSVSALLPLLDDLGQDV
ncbi:MAG TPA: SCO family protein, partial [Candidatus Dormibacteraeota bacterium]|nr:SCO family protein [Candidatus Dormibacteraeota bacterium]